MPNNIPYDRAVWQLHPNFTEAMKVLTHITTKRLFRNIKQRDKYSA